MPNEKKRYEKPSLTKHGDLKKITKDQTDPPAVGKCGSGTDGLTGYLSCS
jgi:hypothetical protein